MQERLPSQVVSFQKSKEALEYYDSRIGRLNQDLDAAVTNKRVQEVIKQIDQLENVVRNAFFEDTKSYNNKSGCSVVGLDFVREMVSKYS